MCRFVRMSGWPRAIPQTRINDSKKIQDKEVASHMSTVRSACRNLGPRYIFYTCRSLHNFCTQSHVNENFLRQPSNFHHDGPFYAILHNTIAILKEAPPWIACLMRLSIWLRRSHGCGTSEQKKRPQLICTSCDVITFLE
jgi:hypothetical protein